MQLRVVAGPVCLFFPDHPHTTPNHLEWEHVDRIEANEGEVQATANGVVAFEYSLIGAELRTKDLQLIRNRSGSEL